MAKASTVADNLKQKAPTETNIKCSQKRDALALANIIYDIYKEEQASVKVSSEITGVSND